MSKEYFRVSHIQKKIDNNINRMFYMKLLSIIFVALIPISMIASRLLGLEPTQKNDLWILSLLVILFMFFSSVYLTKKNKEYEFKFEFYFTVFY